MRKTNPVSGPAFWTPLYEQFQLTLRELRSIPITPPLSQAKAALPLCRTHILSLRKFIQHYTFASAAEEIHFFKAIKPAFYQEYIYTLLLYNLLLRQPIGRVSLQQQYWKQEIQKIEQFYRDHAPFYQYWRSGEQDRDEQYFRRNGSAAGMTMESLNGDDRFNSYGDYLLSRMLAQDRLVIYLNRLIETGDTAAEPIRLNAVHLQWTASKTDLVELVYALQVGGVFNNGQASLKEIVGVMESLFHLELGNYYNTFNEIRARKKVRLTLIDEMKMKLLRKMEEMD